MGKKFLAGIIFFSNVFSYSAQAEQAERFEQCKNNFQHKAIEQGYSEQIVQHVIPSLSYISRAKTLDSNQAEFAESFGEYISRRVTNYRINQGKQKLAEHKVLLSSLYQQYGIPAQYLVAFWGLETNYGKHKGKMEVLNTIATLACDKRRSEFFTNELFTLFDLLDQQVIETKQLRGSWAGAMGHMQFMPSALKTYGIDGDNDGKIDVWNSEVDALTSAANYLHQIGWNTKQRWGRAVTLPKNFDFSQIASDKYYPLAKFKALGVLQKNGQPLANYEIDTELFLPNGHQGPAFLVYPNFNVIMKWNLSKNYASAVGLLANRLVGAKPMNFNDAETIARYTKKELFALQKKLASLGYNTGKPDGILGPNSRKAIRSFQLANNLVADAFPNDEVFEKAQVTRVTATN